jgi:hypothetical protein
LSIIAVALAGLTWAAWRWWPPVIRYRIDRLDAQAVRVEQAYLDGRQALEPSANALARLWNEKTTLWEQVMFEEPSPGAGSLTAVAAPLPPGVSPNDPRLNELGERAMAIMMGPERWRQMQDLRRQSRETRRDHDTT